MPWFSSLHDSSLIRFIEASRHLIQFICRLVASPLIRFIGLLVIICPPTTFDRRSLGVINLFPTASLHPCHHRFAWSLLVSSHSSLDTALLCRHLTNSDWPTVRVGVSSLEKRLPWNLGATHGARKIFVYFVGPLGGSYEVELCIITRCQENCGKRLNRSYKCWLLYFPA